MLPFVRTLLLAAAVSVACALVTLWALDLRGLETLFNRTAGETSLVGVHTNWHLASVLVAACAVAAAAALSHAGGLAVLELAGAAVAGGEIGNLLMFRLYGGVPDFVHAGTWVLSPGDLAQLAGLALLAVGVAGIGARAVLPSPA